MELFRRLLWLSLSIVILLWLKTVWKVSDTSKLLKSPVVVQPSLKVQPKETTTLKNAKVVKALVRFKTDLFEGVISPQGDLIKLDLLNYARNVVTKDHRPFVLLDVTSSEHGMVQSGWVSHDVAMQRASKITYQCEKPYYTLDEGQDSLKIQLHINKEGIQHIKEFVIQRGSYQIHVNHYIKNESQTVWQGKCYAQFEQSKNASVQREVAFSSETQPYEKGTFAKIDKKIIPQRIKQGWIALVEPYFVTAWIPKFEVSSFYTQQKDHKAQFGVVSANYEIQPGQRMAQSFVLYAGPKIAKNLQSAAHYLDQTIDYGFFGFISKGIFWILKQFYTLLGNWGWAIVFTAALLRLLLYPISAQEIHMKQRLQPRIEALKESYKDDPMGLRLAQNQLYQREGIRSWVSIVSLVFAIPTFLAWSGLFRDNVELFQQPLGFWITDLANKDPYYTLPLLLGLLNFIEQKVTPMVQTPGTNQDPTMQNVMLLLPLVVPIFIRNYPSGVLLVWLVQSVLSILQKVWILRDHKI